MTGEVIVVGTLLLDFVGGAALAHLRRRSRTNVAIKQRCAIGLHRVRRRLDLAEFKHGVRRTEAGVCRLLDHQFRAKTTKERHDRYY